MILGEPQKDKPPQQDFTAPPPRGLALFWAILKRDLLKVALNNLLFLLFCLPVVTIPAAYTSMCKVSLSLLRMPTCYVWQEFWGTFRREFLRSTLCGWAYLLLCGMAVVAMRVYARFAAATPALYIIVVFCFLCLLFLIVAGFYFFPLLGTADLPVKAIVKNAAALAVLCIKNNLITLAVLLPILLLIEASLPMSFVFIVLLAIALVNMITTYCAWLGFRRFELLVEKAAPL